MKLPAWLRWPRPHRSTYVVLVLLLGLAALVIVPGECPRLAVNDEQLDDLSDSIIHPGDVLEHGWPLVFLHREASIARSVHYARLTSSMQIRRINFPPSAVPPFGMSAWKVWRDVEWFYPGRLAVDIAIWLLLIMALAWLYELRRRKHARLLQFGVGELLIAAAVAAIACGWITWTVREHRRLCQLLERDIDQDFYPNATIVRPYWLWKMLENSTGTVWGTRLIGLDTNALSLDTAAQVGGTKVIHLRDVPLSEQAAYLGQLNELRELDWDLANLPGLENEFGELEADELKGYLEVLRQMKNCSQLTRLRLPGYPSAQGFVAVGEITQLRLLEMRAPRREKGRPEALSAAELLPLGQLKLLRVLDFSGDERLADSSTSFLSNLTSLEQLDLGGSSVGDETLRRIGVLNDLQQLSVGNTKITSAGVRNLLGLSRLRLLDVSSTAVDDSACSALAQLSGLNQLDLSHTKITSAGAAQIATLKNVTFLNLNEVEIDDRALAAIAHMQSLLGLEIRGARITNQGLAELSRLPQLKYLCLASKELDEDAVPVLSRLEHLESLLIETSSISGSGMRQLEAALPRAVIRYPLPGLPLRPPAGPKKK